MPDTTDLIKIWESMDVSANFLAIDLGENAGVVRVIPFEDGNDPGKIVDERQVDYNPKSKQVVCPNINNSLDNPECILSTQVCPINGLIDFPMFKSFLLNCILTMEEKKQIMLRVYSLVHL
jgi:hypothetical protein